MQRHPAVLSLRRWGAIAVTSLVASTVTAVPAHATTSTDVAFSGNAYGTQITVGSLVSSGATAYATLGCTNQAGQTVTNNTAAVNLVNGLQNIGKTGTTVSTLATSTDGSTSTMRSDSDVQFVKLLDGVITLDALHATATTTGLPFANTGRTTFINLKINGQGYAAEQAPNTKIDLGPLGYVVLNEQKKSITSTGASMKVTALHLVLFNSSSPATPINVVVGQATSKLTGSVAGTLTGYAWGSQVTLLNNTVISGKTSYVALPCLGTGNALLTNATAAVNVPLVLSTGTNASSGKGLVDASTTSGTVTNEIQGVNLFGRIKASVIKTQLAGTRPNGGAESLQDGSQFIGLTIDGTTYAADVPVNTKISLAGLGTLWLHRRVELANGVTEIRMIELVLGQAAGGLPIGTRVRIGVAGLDLRD